jgi:hypothetical protein
MSDINEVVDITPSGKKNIILDSQILTALMNCPRNMDLRFNHNFFSLEGKSNSLECGSIVHKFLEVMYGSIIKGLKREQAVGFGLAAAELYIQGCPDCTDFIPYHDSLYTNTEPPVASHFCGPTCIRKPKCGHHTNEYPGVTNTPKDSADYKTGWQHVLDTCDEYAKFYASDHWVPLEVETVKGEILYEDDEIRVLWKAKLDLICDTNQGIYPIDHKTMKQRRDTISLNNQFIGQCILMRTRNIFINKIGFQATLKPEEKFLRPPISYSAARLLEWQAETLPFYAKQLLMYAEVGHYPPQFGQCEGKYGNCAFIDVCTSDPGMREEELKLHFTVGQTWDISKEKDDD